MPPAAKTPSLYPFQEQGALHLSQRRFAFLADSMGLGKTPQAIAAIVHLLRTRTIADPGNILSGPIYIIAPLATMPGWLREFATWAPHLKPVVYRRKDKLPHAAGPLGPQDRYDCPAPGTPHICLIPYTDLAPRWRHNFDTTLLPPGLVILDEAHCLRNALDSHSARVLDRLFSFACSRADLAKTAAPRFWALSATPTPNGRPREMFLFLSLSGCFRPCDIRNPGHRNPSQYPTGPQAFLDRYCRRLNPNTPSGFDYLGASHLDEFSRYLAETDLVLQRFPEDVPGQLPEILRLPLLRATPAPREMAEACVPAAGKEEGDYLRGPQIAKAEQAVATYFEKAPPPNPSDPQSGLPAFEDFSRYRASLAARKAVAALKWIEDTWHEHGDPLVIFAHHLGPGQWLADALRALPDSGPVEFASGSDNPQERQAKVDRFADIGNPGAPRYLVATLSACGTGMNGMHLRTTDALFVELPWDAATLDQAEGRVRRIGGVGGVDGRPARMWYLGIADCMDAHIVQLIASKRSRTATMAGHASRSQPSQPSQPSPEPAEFPKEAPTNPQSRHSATSPLTARWSFAMLGTTACVLSEGAPPERAWMGREVPVVDTKGGIHYRILGAPLKLGLNWAYWIAIDKATVENVR